MKPSQYEFKVMEFWCLTSGEYEMKKAYNAAFKNLFMAKGFGIILKKTQRLFFRFKKLRHCRFDGIAAALQFSVEEVLVKWIKNCINKTKIKNVIIVGAAQNIKAAIPISEIKDVKILYKSSSGDTTLSVGGCYYISSLENKLKLKNLKIYI